MPDFSLDIPCPICLAQAQKKCELLTGAPRSESHVERKWIAQDLHRKTVFEEPAPFEVPRASNFA
jgi:hypothetical protein